MWASTGLLPRNAFLRATVGYVSHDLGSSRRSARPKRGVWAGSGTRHVAENEALVRPWATLPAERS
jgi:hypothetical protein